MGKLTSAGSVVLLLVAATASATPIINVGSHDVPVGTTAFDIAIMIAGGDALTDMVGYVQVADGGPELGGSIDGPEITGISYTGSIWEGAPGGYTAFFGSAPVGTYPQLIDPSVSLTVGGQNVPATGVLLSITVDVTGFSVCETFDLKLAGTIPGDTALENAGTPVTPTINNGTIHITPEPATMSLLALAGIATLIRRRRRR